MRLTLLLAAVLAPVFAVPAAAQVSGGQVNLSYSALTNDGDFNRTSLESAVEYSLSQNFSVQGDLAFHSFGFSNDDIATLTLHGIYHVDDSISLGAFVSVDRADGDNITILGIEGGRDFGQFDVEGYLGGFRESGDNGTLIGAKARYAYTNEIGFGGVLDHGNLSGGDDLTRFGINADYRFAGGSVVSAEIGQIHVGTPVGSGSEAYAKIGFGFEFGNKRGATFDNRSLTRLLPGL